VHLRDLRGSLGDRLNELEAVDVLVVTDEGGAIAARLELTTVRSGPSTRRVLVCPLCQEPRYVLFARKGRLECSRHHRTRRQAELHRADFQRRGGLEEDKLLRLLTTASRRTTPGRLQEAARLVSLLLRADRARLAVLQEQVATLTVVAAST
jgi:hypothetical protein